MPCHRIGGHRAGSYGPDAPEVTACPSHEGTDWVRLGVRTLVGAILGVAISSWLTAQGDMERFMAEYVWVLELLLTGLPL